jgi:cation diffusion facilitator family transporter
MVAESVERLISPIDIAFNQAIAVAVVGLIVNAVSAVVLAYRRANGHHEHSHGDHHHSHTDHNLKAAFLHVVADALTSVLAIIVPLIGKYWNVPQIDPAMGIVGAILVARWSWTLVKQTSGTLLDRQAPEQLRERIKSLLEEQDDNRLADLHVWSIGPGLYAASLSIVTSKPHDPEYYRRLFPRNAGLVHSTIEVSSCRN